MEYLLINAVILKPEAFHDISQQFLLALQFRKFAGIHSVFVLQTLLRIRAEHKSEYKIVNNCKRKSYNKEHQHLTHIMPC